MRAYGLQCSAFSYVVSAQSTSKSFEQIQRWHHLEFLQQQQGSWKAGGRSASKWDEVLWRTRRQLKSCQTDSDLLLFMVLFSIIPIFLAWGFDSIWPNGPATTACGSVDRLLVIFMEEFAGANKSFNCVLKLWAVSEYFLNKWEAWKPALCSLFEASKWPCLA